MVPAYGAGSLADVAPSLLAALGVPGTVDVLGFAPTRKVCLLLVDGLGWQLLNDHAADAPFLASLAAANRAITCGFPATTATSLASLGTGTPAGEHGVVGYSFAAGDELLNALRWHRHGVAEHVDLRPILIPEEVQPNPTVWQRAEAAGVAVRLVVPRVHERSGLSRAVLRGGHFRGTHALGDLVSRAVDAMREPGRVFCYAYHADLDAIGHVYGPGSDAWRWQLRFVDHLAASLAGDLPPDSTLVVTADHGMVAATDKIDIDAEERLREGVRLLGGEARVRHVYTLDGAVEDVRANWTAVLGDRAWIATREEAADNGWFGPRVSDRVRERIGDLVVAAKDSLSMIRSASEPHIGGFLGQHGSLTAQEQLVPLLIR
ncbi:alkaline phosphatase family protein [Allokutzneria sp. A3M-2-11 16]|uniref:alkaline phosphatase family protein n=1 Tax=Allokutzneria sp. A3M-2-11 16 TaxID=2962043 RepID=UPI0020B8EDC1|nr:nucleotide pyrophosphatase/phosphodiesterase family protein [Allokutzneria sp. A3M-2-11 16]MCP3805020.1 alkaline phosphatase family protein [Allokutzneria sp. A3M-2-11 16]